MNRSLPARSQSRLRTALCGSIPLLALLVASAAANAQTATEEWRFSLHGGGQLLRHDTEIPGLPDVPSCAPGYGAGNGGGMAIGLGAGRTIVPGLSAGVRLLYQTFGATLTTNETSLVSAETDTVTAVFMHTIETTHRALGAELVVAYEVTSGLHLLAGGRLDVLTGASYEQREEILSPGNIRYENDRRTRNEYAGELAGSASTSTAVLAGVRYDLALDRDRTLVLSPEALVWQGLGSLDPSAPWTVQGLRVGVSVSYILFGERAPSPIEPGIEKAPVPAPDGEREARPVPGR
jgi:hypothetical protein